jgi:hypothetical protein
VKPLEGPFYGPAQILRGTINSQPQKYLSKTLTRCHFSRRNGPKRNAPTTAFDSGSQINIHGRKWARVKQKHNISARDNPFSFNSALCPSLDAILLSARCGIFIHAIKSVTLIALRKFWQRAGGERKLLAFCGAEKIARRAERPSVDVHRESPSVLGPGSKRRRWSWIWLSRRKNNSNFSLRAPRLGTNARRLRRYPELGRPN